MKKHEMLPDGNFEALKSNRFTLNIGQASKYISNYKADYHDNLIILKMNIKRIKRISESVKQTEQAITLRLTLF